MILLQLLALVKAFCLRCLALTIDFPEGQINNHGFVDGNTPTAVAVTIIFLSRNGHQLQASQKEVVDLAVGLASNRLSFEQALSWLKKHSKKVSKSRPQT